jgi:hypothetical protein
MKHGPHEILSLIALGGRGESARRRDPVGRELTIKIFAERLADRLPQKPVRYKKLLDSLWHIIKKLI